MVEPPGGSQTGRLSTKTTTSGRTLRSKNNDDQLKQKSTRVIDAGIPTLVTALHDLAQMAGLTDQYREGIHAFAYAIFSTYADLQQQWHSEQQDSVKEHMNSAKYC